MYLENNRFIYQSLSHVKNNVKNLPHSPYNPQIEKWDIVNIYIHILYTIHTTHIHIHTYAHTYTHTYTHIRTLS